MNDKLKPNVKLPYTLKNGYPSPLNDEYPIHQKMEENNIITNNINTHIEQKNKNYEQRTYPDNFFEQFYAN